MNCIEMARAFAKVARVYTHIYIYIHLFFIITILQSARIQRKTCTLFCVIEQKWLVASFWPRASQTINSTRNLNEKPMQKRNKNKCKTKNLCATTNYNHLNAKISISECVRMCVLTMSNIYRIFFFSLFRQHHVNKCAKQCKLVVCIMERNRLH